MIVMSISILIKLDMILSEPGDILAPCQEYINDCKNAIQKEIDDDKNKIGIQNIQDIYKVIKDDAININEKMKKIDDFLNL